MDLPKITVQHLELCLQVIMLGILYGGFCCLLLQLNAGYLKCGVTGQQHQCQSAAAAAKIRHAGMFVKRRKGGAANTVGTELKVSVRLQKRYAVP